MLGTLRSKVVVVAIVGMLAMCVGLTACGGSSASSSSAASSSAASSSAASSAAASSSAASSSAASEEALYWEGTLSDGSSILFMDDAADNLAAVVLATQDLSSVRACLGNTTTSDGVTTLTDSENNLTISYTLSNVTSTSMTMDIQGVGAVELKAVTAADFRQLAVALAAVADEGEKILKAVEAEAQKLATELGKEADKLVDEFNKLDDSTVFFWNGTLADGSTVTYMDDSATSEATLIIAKPDFSDGAVWSGKYSVGQDGKTTLTDSTSKATITYEVVETTDSSMKMNIDWVGEVSLTPTTKGDLVNLAEELSKLANAA